ncbi:MAG TPA: DUF4367 domain-containing protein [Bacillales bacterium]|nr:DUF4367 domain-containing protein [Bacillales bacterium]
MSGPKKDTYANFKAEADKTIFMNIQFTEEMKENVRMKVKHSNKRSQASLNKFWLSFTAIAAVAVISIVSLSTMFAGNERSDLNKSRTNEMSTLSSKESENSNLIAGAPEIKVWEINSLSEVKQLFPGVILPTYNAESFQQKTIKLSGENENEPNSVIFTFALKDKSYIVTVEKDDDQLKPVGLEHVDINGLTGYLSSEDNGQEITEIHFYTAGYHYMINGLISSEEALKIARSFK